MCVAAQVVVEHVLHTGFLDTVIAKGKRIRAGLEELRSTGKVVEVRGTGLLNGVELNSAETADMVVNKARERGLIVVKANATTVRLVPALNVEDEEIELALTTIGSVLAESG